MGFHVRKQNADHAGSPGVALPTGVLTLTVDRGPDLDDLCAIAARANPRRGFLIVSKVLGRHLPARPAAMRRTMNELARSLPRDLPEPIAFLGMAETATALGQGIFAAFQAMHPQAATLYLQTSRQIVTDASIIARFEEGHSHATSHLVQIRDARLAETVRQARSLIIIDDECSTGNTFLSAAAAMLEAMPRLERIETCCITDWSGGAYLRRMARPADGHAILAGHLHWEPHPGYTPPALAARSNETGHAPARGMNSRSGLWHPDSALRDPVSCAPQERILVLGDGEHSYEALLIAEEIDAAGGIAAVQSITRTPALPGGAMKSVARFTDAYGSGAPCFLYNILEHRPDRIIIASEIRGRQAGEARAVLKELGADSPVERIHCTYSGIP